MEASLRRPVEVIVPERFWRPVRAPVAPGLTRVEAVLSPSGRRLLRLMLAFATWRATRLSGSWYARPVAWWRVWGAAWAAAGRSLEEPWA
jgi:hypothetical protein